MPFCSVLNVVFEHLIKWIRDDIQPPRAQPCGFDSLSDSERLQFISMVQGLLRVWEEAFFQLVEDRLDCRVWTSTVAQYRDWMSSKGFQRVWELRKHTYNLDFQKFVEDLALGNYKLN